MVIPVNTASVGPPPTPIPSVPDNPVVGTSPAGKGILGQANTGVGVWGESLGVGGGREIFQPPGDGVVGRGRTGVHGTSTYSGGSGSGVLGESTGSGVGVSGSSVSGDGVFGTGAHNGVHGRSASSNDSGVWGDNTGSGVGVSGSSVNGDGVFGTGAHNGVHGRSASSNDSGVWGDNTTTGYGMAGTSANGVGVYGRGGNLAAHFEGKILHDGQLSHKGDLTHNGNTTMSGTLSMGPQGDVTFGDCAEQFLVIDAEIEPGTVMVIGHDGNLRPSSDPYDRKVAGVVSGAGDFRPGIVLGKSIQAGQRMPIALVGKVYCKVDAERFPIAVGDLLTTSPTPGFAMKAADPLKAFGAVIGKALDRLESGQGLIPILVALQ
jgi:hypothetical protein